MSAEPENPDEIVSVTNDPQESYDNPVPAEPVQAEVEASQAWPCWKKGVVVAAGAVVTATVSVIATLAATHRSAVRENLIAYNNGFSDSTRLPGRYSNGFLDGFEAGVADLASYLGLEGDPYDQ